MNRADVLFFAFLSTMILAGCGRAPSKVDQFKIDQQATVTPHGRIDMDSAAETPDGKIEYNTSDGNRWQVEVSVAPDGSQRYSRAEKNKN